MEPLRASAARLGGISLLRLQSDERLAELASAGREEAFEALVRRYRRGLLRSCLRILPEDRAEDAVQQALLDAHRALLRNGAPRSLRPWLNRIAVNAALRELRDDEDTVPLDEEHDGVDGPEQVRERRERLGRLLAAIHALPGRQRRAFVLRELEGRSHEEIARELGLSDGAVRQLIHRARNSVRAGASALIPPALVLRILGHGGGATATRLAEAGPGAESAGIATKLAVAAIVAGGVAGGVAIERERDGRDGAGSEAQASAPKGSAGATASGAGAAGLGGSGPADATTSGRGSGDGGGGPGSSSGPGGGGSDDQGSGGSGSSGPSGGSDSSGHGSDDEPELQEEVELEPDDSSGSGSSLSGSSGSGSSGSGSSGSSASGSGSSGSGSGSSGSDSSG